ncbi:MAG: hypothetical protein GXO26_09065 [Crenarchaeota archaeon]|nr:hypothetical protein [Thermoproteota archaeon]
MKLRTVRVVVLHQVSFLDEYIFGSVTLRMLLMLTGLGLSMIVLLLGLAMHSTGLVIVSIVLGLPCLAYTTCYIATRGIVNVKTYLRAVVRNVFRRPHMKIMKVRLGNTTILVRPIIGSAYGKDKNKSRYGARREIFKASTRI